VAVLGYYNPLSQPHELKVQKDEVLAWLHKGATPTETARSLLQQTGVWQHYQLLKQGKPAEAVEAEVAAILEKRQARAAASAAKASAAKAAKQAAPAPAVEAPEVHEAPSA
jgi:small subunit ribosomal protein S16